VKLCSSPFFTTPAFFAPATALAFSAVLPGLGNFMSNVLLILPMICTIGTTLPFLNLHHPHLYVDLSRKVLLLYLHGRQQPVKQNRQAEGVHHNHDAPVVGIGINIVQGGQFCDKDRNPASSGSSHTLVIVLFVVFVVLSYNCHRRTQSTWLPPVPPSSRCLRPAAPTPRS
jgi:hypothetical protein